MIQNPIVNFTLDFLIEEFYHFPAYAGIICDRVDKVSVEELPFQFPGKAACQFKSFTAQFFGYGDCRC